MQSKRFQQSNFWAQFKCAHGWVSLNYNDVSVLYRTFGKSFLKFSIAYIPMALEKKSDGEMEYVKKLSDFAGEIKPLLPKHTLCVRYDLPIDLYDNELRNDYVNQLKSIAKKAKVKLLKTRVDVQPPDTVVLPLDMSEDELLGQMKNKWRYNIRYADKHGVKVRCVHAGDADFEKDLQSFYNLYKTTAQRDGIGIHPLAYYKDLLCRGSCDKNNSDTVISLYIASHEDEDLAAIVTLFNKDESIYLYGCSGNVKRNLMPAYLVQWTAIKDAKTFGSKVYDFYGIPPVDNPSHPMHGLYLFKTGFGGKIVHRPGTFDVPVSKLYKLYILAENIRAFWHKKVLKKIRGR